MVGKTHIQKRVSFLLWCYLLGIFIFICVPWIEEQLIPADMKQVIEEKEINPAHLFYTESAASSDAIYDLVGKKPLQKQIKIDERILE